MMCSGKKDGKSNMPTVTFHHTGWQDEKKSFQLLLFLYRLTKFREILTLRTLMAWYKGSLTYPRIKKIVLYHYFIPACRVILGQHWVSSLWSSEG